MMVITLGAHSINNDDFVLCHSKVCLLDDLTPWSSESKGIKREATILLVNFIATATHMLNSNTINTLPTNRSPPPTRRVIFTMLYTTILAFAVAALAAPVEEKRQAPLCSGGGGGTPQCCATNVLNLADLDCSTRKLLPTRMTCKKING
jgi:hypothetical protein